MESNATHDKSVLLSFSFRCLTGLRMTKKRSTGFRFGAGIITVVVCGTFTVRARAEAPSFEFAALADDSPACVKILGNPTEAFEIRKQLIRTAKSELLVSYYALVRDIKPMYIIALLQEAAERGVKIRMILDDYNSNLPKEMLRYLKEHGVATKYYNPMKLANLRRIDRRMHDKYIVVDRSLVLVGGRNLKDGYFNPDLGAKKTFYDLDALFLGDPATQAAEYFDRRWTDSPWVEDTTLPKVNDVDYIDLTNTVANAYAEMKAGGELSARKTVEDYAIVACAKADFVANDPITRARDRSVESAYIREIDHSTISVEIQNPYILPTREMKQAIKRALKRGVRVTMITNSLKSIDIGLTQSAYLNLRPRLLKWGVQIYEFIHTQTLHSKIAIFDGRRVVVGSFNLDPRSAKLNSEDFVVTDDPLAVGPVRAYFDQTTGLSTKIGLNGKPEGYDERHPGTTFGQRLLNVIFRFTIAPILRGKL